MEMNKYVERLVNEWRQHGKIVIALDFDDTIFNWALNDTITYESVIDLVKKAQYTGAYITIFSACAPNRHNEIKEFCKKRGIIVDSINTNPIDLPYGHHGKIFANIFLDDRAGLDQSMSILEEAMYIIRGEKAKELINGETPYST